jgi:hypothetical protein
MIKTERRLGSRYLCADLVQADTAIGRLDAVLEDISTWGACLETEISIPPGSRITFQLGAEEFTGRVCYSAYRDCGYLIGIRFREEDEWSEEIASPNHLLCLEDITAQ